LRDIIRIVDINNLPFNSADYALYLVC